MKMLYVVVLNDEILVVRAKDLRVMATENNGLKKDITKILKEIKKFKKRYKKDV